LKSSHHSYRPDIDGLRAIAVLAVVAFHAAPGRVSGGFIGVDVFFVISGYLISSIIIKSLENGTFSFVDFYARRIRRIFPALLLVMWVCLLAGWFLFVEQEYELLGKHIVGGAAFVSNLVLYSESSYFDANAMFKPFLHLWSLGIEEQFYIFWPLILWVAWIRKIRLLKTIVYIAGFSFLVSLYLTSTNPVSAFYLPFSRFWELLFGAMLAHYVLHHKTELLTTVTVSSHLMSLLGTIFIFTGFVLINKDGTFPGWWALLPVCGAVLVISAGPDAYLNRHVYSNRFLVWFGLISYPLYLWHWPLLSFFRTLKSGEMPPLHRIVLITVSVLFAWLTYKFIERPIISTATRKKTVTRILVSLMVMTGLIGYAGYTNEGFHERFGWAPKVINTGDIGHSEFFKYMEKHYYPCTPKSLYKESGNWNGFVRCYQSKDVIKKDVAIIGDSHAEAMFVGIAEAFEDRNVVYYAKGGPPFAENKKFSEVFNVVLQDRDIKVVLLKARWLSKFKGVGNDLLQLKLNKTAELLVNAGKNVFLVEDVPDFPFEPNVCKYNRSVVSIFKCSMPDKKQSSKYMSIFEAVQQQVPSVKIIRTNDFFCSDGNCDMAKDRNLFFRDSNHLNVNGSIALGKFMVNKYPDLGVNYVEN
jgi:peptidoglycan/LPS O-acetylase OafA/YrhL